MKRYLRAFGLWLLMSSKDSKKVSLSFKSALLGVVTILTIFKVDTSSLPAVIDSMVFIFEHLLLLVSGIVTLYGLFRKVKLTYLGQNAVLNDDAFRE